MKQSSFNSSYYFSHDFNAIADPKIQILLNKFGALGYGLYWRIIELLHSEKENKLELSKININSLNALLKIDNTKEIIDFCVNECELFILQENYIFSKRVKRNIEKRKIEIENKSKAGKKSAENRKQTSTGVEQASTGVEQVFNKNDKNEILLNTIQQNKVNKVNKVNKIKESNHHAINSARVQDISDDEVFLNNNNSKFDSIIEDWNSIFVENFKFQALPLIPPAFIREQIIAIKEMWDTPELLKAINNSKQFLQNKKIFHKFWHNPENIKKVLAGNFSDENFNKNYKPEDPRGKYINPADPKNKLGNTWEKPYIGPEYVNNPNSIYYGKKKIIVG